MNGTIRGFLRTGFAAGVLFAVAGSAGAQNTVQECRFAIISKVAPSGQPPCVALSLEELSRQGLVFELSQNGIASGLVVGRGTTAKEALKWFEKAAISGSAPAEVNLAVMYANGWGTQVNYGAALNWLHAAAKQGFARAYFDLGILYMEGKGVRRDDAEAVRWLQKGAQAGDSDSQTNLGFMYDAGLGTNKDRAAAAAWYRKAADSGNPLAENNLADLYLHGDGVPQDDAGAFRLFDEAAQQGHSGASIMLAYMYAQGRGTKEDPEAALAWIIAASHAGDQRGQDLAASLRNSLTTEQIARAEQLANTFQHGLSQRATLNTMTIAQQ